MDDCKTCNILINQIEFLQKQNQHLLDLIGDMVKPAPIVSVVTEPKELQPVKQEPIRWTRKRSELERQDRIAAHVNKTSPNIAKSDSQLEELKKDAEQLEGELNAH